ncbi:uncharacterized protein A1O9_08525 [Exophiala aquamarina CBS 119918]|uniref:Glycosyl hydrolase family 13 catalytic domain-containing protein n=1 Tax=Exophiala aquamarina CBS 119918 TaxID=1182545 RepID=A0A072P6R1_9EURO|nr:uncharacterized protein A1O9_08525 [Exophiala aquamarina CBS 119918]KEF55774.1 hypothetical protein A1O9_08525 [Exophiala aquamarina CBS 119918]
MTADLAIANATETPNSNKLSLELRFQEQLSENSNVQKTRQPSWWKDVVVYQVWPASFKDSNGDGLGDLRGVISKLDYLKELGVDVVWLSPIYDSPQEDMGYDVSDYNNIYPPYGTMDDMEELIAGLHIRGMKIIMDLVINHTSSEHWWFKESYKSRQGKYADFYMWKDAKVGQDGRREPPSNWGSVFGGSAWEWVEERQQYYLHIFSKGQPDLNWESAEARKEIHESAMRFWFKKGVDGFRVDTCDIYSKDPELRDTEPTPRTAPFGDPQTAMESGPRIHEYWRAIRKQVLDDFGDPLMVGEMSLTSFEDTLKYIGREPRELSMIFDFTYATLGTLHDQPLHHPHPFKLSEAKAAMKRTQDYVAHPAAWSSVFKENHDFPRSVSRFGTQNPKYWKPAAKLLAMMTATLSGTLFLYQGEEIGMTNIPDAWSVEDLKDISSINYWNRMKEQYHDDKEMMANVWKAIVNYSRDNGRTPVQWSSEKNAGFTTGKPWMRVNDNYKSINVEDQQQDKDSVLAFWQQLLQQRKLHKDIFVYGSYEVRNFDNEQTWTFMKQGDNGRTAWIVLNFSEEDAAIDLPIKHGKLILSNMPSNGDSLIDRLKPFEGRIYMGSQTYIREK